jgi:hypothetical protein
MTAFEEIQALIREESLISDELRIIASDAHLCPADRASLVNGAAMIERMLQNYSAVHAALMETQRQLIATQERLIEANRMLSTGLVFPTISARIDITHVPGASS